MKKLGLFVALIFLLIFWFILSFRETEGRTPVTPIPQHTAKIQKHNPIDSIYRNSLSFSMDGEYFAYLFHRSEKIEAQSGNGRLSQKTLTDSLYIKWFSIDTPTRVCSLLIDAIDLGAEGYHHYELNGNLQSNRTTNKFAVFTPHRISIFNPEDSSSLQISFENEFFGNGRWLNTDTITFSTIKEDSISFWKLNVNDEANERISVYSRKYEHFYNTDAPKLLEERWSPDGSFVIFSNSAGYDEVLLNITTGTIKTFPFPIKVCFFNNNGSHFIVRDFYNEYDRVYLIESESGDTQDLTQVFQDSVGQTGLGKDISIGFESWTSDEVIVMSITNSKRPNNAFQGWTHNTKYHLIQPLPFKTILVSEHISSTPSESWIEKFNDNQLSLYNFNNGEAIEIDLGYNVIKKWSPDLKYYVTISENRPIVHSIEQN